MTKDEESDFRDGQIIDLARKVLVSVSSRVKGLDPMHVGIEVRTDADEPNNRMVVFIPQGWLKMQVAAQSQTAQHIFKLLGEEWSRRQYEVEHFTDGQKYAQWLIERVHAEIEKRGTRPLNDAEFAQAMRLRRESKK